MNLRGLRSGGGLSGKTPEAGTREQKWTPRASPKSNASANDTSRRENPQNRMLAASLVRPLPQDTHTTLSNPGRTKERGSPASAEGLTVLTPQPQQNSPTWKWAGPHLQFQLCTPGAATSCRAPLLPRIQAPQGCPQTCSPAGGDTHLPPDPVPGSRCEEVTLGWGPPPAQTGPGVEGGHQWLTGSPL